VIIAVLELAMAHTRQFFFGWQIPKKKRFFVFAAVAVGGLLCVV
jgi:hypothetical protein